MMQYESPKYINWSLFHLFGYEGFSKYVIFLHLTCFSLDYRPAQALPSSFNFTAHLPVQWQHTKPAQRNGVTDIKMPASKIKGKCAVNTVKIPPVHFYAVHLISRLKNFDKLESKCCINVRSLELLHTGEVSVSFVVQYYITF